MSSNEDQPTPISDGCRQLFAAYQADRTNATWTRLSQYYVGQRQVIDGLRELDPSFPDPYPLDGADLIENDDDYYQWPTLPNPALVLKAIVLLAEGQAT